jgi:hypothetical protein
MTKPDIWFWDPAAPFQVNHRLVYLGLDHRQGYYKWADGSQLAFSDWYQPPEEWEQPPVFPDTQVQDILHLTARQPIADSASLCTVLMMKSPFASSSWVRVPCDYPIFRAGVICEKPAAMQQGVYSLFSRPTNPDALNCDLLSLLPGICPKGYYQVNSQCYTLKQISVDASADEGCPEDDSMSVASDDVEFLMKHMEDWLRTESIGVQYHDDEGGMSCNGGTCTLHIIGFHILHPTSLLSVHRW